MRIIAGLFFSWFDFRHCCWFIWAVPNQMILALTLMTSLWLRPQFAFAGDVIRKLATIVASPHLSESFIWSVCAALQLLIHAGYESRLHALIAGDCLELQRLSFG